MAAPYEIIAAPFTIYLAPVGESNPVIDAAVGGNWVKVGTSGDKNYSDDGVKITHDQSINVFRGAGSTVPRKAFREEEDVKVEFELADLSPAQYAKIINNASVTTVAQSTGVAGQKYFELAQGLTVATFALLARGKSTVDESLNAQLELDAVYQNASPEPEHGKSGAAMLACEFIALDAAGDGAIGKMRIQTTVAGS